MRIGLLIAALAVCNTALLAQLAGPTAGLEIVLIIHEPSESDVGPNIAAIQVPNPYYDPVQPNGEPQYLKAYGNGGGIADELDSISDEFYALASTTTHDLAVILNTTGADIVMDSATLTVAACRANTTASEQSSPDGGAGSIALPMSATSMTNPGVSVTLTDGSSVAAFIVITKWRSSLDTSPREYIWTFTFNDTIGTAYVVEGDLLVPEVGGTDPSGCVSSDNGFPSGVWLVATGGLFAIVVRRRLLEKSRA